MYTKDDQPGQQEATQGSGRHAQAHDTKNHPQEDKPGKRESGPRHPKTINPMEERSQEDRDRFTGTQRQATQRDEIMGSRRPAQGTQRRATQQYGSQKGEARQAQGTQCLTLEWQGASWPGHAAQQRQQQDQDEEANSNKAKPPNQPGDHLSSSTHSRHAEKDALLKDKDNTIEKTIVISKRKIEVDTRAECAGTLRGPENNLQNRTTDRRTKI